MVEARALSVHRCRFVDFTPAGVTALAFPPLALPSPKGKKAAIVRHAMKFANLAVGRANGNIDRKSTRLNSSHSGESRMPSSA